MFSIIIVEWENCDQARKCVESIQKNSHYQDHEIIVFHNEASDRLSIIDNVLSLYSTQNLGLTRAANIAAKASTKDYICLIDDDMTVAKDWDSALISGLDKY